jgi:DNA-binding transcriptional MerR regulator
LDKAPDAFRTISEVAEDLDVPQHVLRFWESRFAQIKPMKRGGGRRYYRPEDVALLRGIRHLLYGQGYTIRGVQRILREQGVRFVQTVWEEGADQPPPDEEAVAAEAPAEEETGTSRGVLGRLRSSPPSRPMAAGGRREPTFATADEETAAEPRAAQPRGTLTAKGRLALQAALAELAECRKRLDAAMDEAT